MVNLVAIVGRPNVGKSTLFNRLIEKRKAIMGNEPGVTRDRHYGFSEWIGKHFTVIDTGGYIEGSQDILETAIRTQVKLAIDEAHVILFMVDCSTGLTSLDSDFAKVIRTTNKPVFIVANKADNMDRALMANEFYELGMDIDIFPISSQSGFGTGDLLDEVVKAFPDEGHEDPEAGIPRIAIIGRPNVGKSSFLNVLLNEERSIVTDIAGTTRDSINSRYKMFGKDFILVDTAGVRKKSKVREDIEFYSVLRSIQSLQDSDVCIIMLDATRGMESQDIHLINLAYKYKKGVMIMFNKWDLIEKDHKTADQIRKDTRFRLGSLGFIPIIFTSVINKKGIFQSIEVGIKINGERLKKISTSKLNEKMLAEIENHSPPTTKGKHIKIKYVTQLPTKTPSFAFFCNLPQYIKEPYERYLTNKLREHFGFEGAPITIFFRKK